MGGVNKLGLLERSVMEKLRELLFCFFLQILILYNLEIGEKHCGTRQPEYTGWSGVARMKSRPAAEEGMDGNAWHVSIQALFWQCVV